MILIEPFNSAVRDTLLGQFQAYQEYFRNPESCKKPPNFDCKIADFDGALFEIKLDSETDILTVSISLSFYAELEKAGESHTASKFLAKEYGNYLKPASGAGSSVTLEIDCKKLPEDVDVLAKKAALLRRNCYASLFEHFFDYQVANASEPSAKILQSTIHFRPGETMFVQAMSDRVTVIFSTRFKDPGDVVLGNVFLQEFSEVKRRYDGAPQVIYQQRHPPKELSGTGAVSDDNMAYVTFVLSPRHLTPTNRAKTIDLIHLMRTYMHYHIKCMKAYLQMRMRAKTVDFLKILNRARPSADVIGTRKFVVDVDTDTGIKMLSASASLEDQASFRFAHPS